MNTENSKRQKSNVDRIKENLIQSAKLPDNKNLISAREVWLYYVGDNKSIYWIKSYKTLLKYISEDYVDIFKPVTLGQVTGTRYYVKIDNIANFIDMFESNSLQNRRK
jgi:phage pi2 protein 07